jgi:hypothetical protein
MSEREVRDVMKDSLQAILEKLDGVVCDENGEEA